MNRLPRRFRRSAPSEADVDVGGGAGDEGAEVRRAAPAAGRDRALRRLGRLNGSIAAGSVLGTGAIFGLIATHPATAHAHRNTQVTARTGSRSPATGGMSAAHGATSRHTLAAAAAPTVASSSKGAASSGAASSSGASSGAASSSAASSSAASSSGASSGAVSSGAS